VSARSLVEFLYGRRPPPNRRLGFSEGIVAVWTLRVTAVLLLLVSAFGFSNALYFRIHGPGGDLGLVAGVLALLAWAAARWERNSDT